MLTRFAALTIAVLMAIGSSFGATIGEALEQPDLVWETGGDAPWDVETTDTSDGEDALQAGAISDNYETWVQTTVTGPVLITFKWKASSEQDFDLLTVKVDDVSASSISGITAWQDGSVIVPEGVHTVRWTFAKDDSELDGLDTAWLDQVKIFPLVDLNAALDTPGLIFGATDWFGIPNGQDGIDSAQSGAVEGDGKATLQTSVTGPGTLTFYWKVSSEQNFDLLSLIVDGKSVAAISGEVDWTLKSYQIPDGTHIVAWVYSKDTDTSEGADAGWVDQISFGGPIDLTNALDGTGIAWTTSADSPWTGERLVTHDTVDAAESASITSSQETWVQAAVTGPIQVSFWWKVSCETNFDFLNLLVDGAQVERISGEIDWTHRAISLPSGSHTIRWRYAKDASGSGGQDKAWLDQVTLVSSISLGDALEQPTLDWRSGGAASWLGEIADTHDGLDAARSGAILDGQESWIETTITGPTTLSYSWKASSETNFDTLAILIDGAIRRTISGEVDWRQETFDITAGPHTIRWRYLKDESDISGRDTVWLDQISISGQGASPRIGIVQLSSNALSIPISNLTPDAPYVIEVSTNLKKWTALSTNTATASTATIQLPIDPPAEFLRIRIGDAPILAPAALTLLHINITSGPYAGDQYDVHFFGTTNGTFIVSGDFQADGSFTYEPSGNTASLRLNYSQPVGDYDLYSLTFQTDTTGAFTGAISASGSTRPIAGDFTAVAQ